MILLFFNKLLKFLPKKHKFDLENPGVIKTSNFNFPKYTCEKCGKSYSLDHWQMLDLPFSMKYGCTK